MHYCTGEAHLVTAGGETWFDLAVQGTVLGNAVQKSRSLFPLSSVMDGRLPGQGFLEPFVIPATFPQEAEKAPREQSPLQAGSAEQDNKGAYQSQSRALEKKPIHTGDEWAFLPN